MSTVRSIVLFAACLQLISCQSSIPPECLSPPRATVNPVSCCKIPPFFPDEDFEGCGFMKLDAPPDPSKFNGVGVPEKLDCTRQFCILDKYSLRKGDDIDMEAVSNFLDEWVATNTEFKPVIDLVKQTCLLQNLPGPPNACPGNNMIMCLSSLLFSECPTWKNTPECTPLQNFMTKCKPFFKRI